MDLEANPELIFGEEFCFTSSATYYPTPYGPAGITLPAELYEQQRIWRCGDQDLQYLGQQDEGTSYSYYVVPEYGIAHSPLGPYPSEHRAIADGRCARSQEYLAKTADIAYHQPVPIPHYDVLPSAAHWSPASTAQALTYNDSLFIPSEQGQSPVAPKKGITRNPSLQSTSVSSKKFENHAMLSTVQVRSTDPWKQNLAAGSGTRVPAKPRRAPQPQAPRHPPHGRVPPVKSLPQTNPSYSYNASHVGSDLRKMAIAEKFQASSKPRSYVNGLTGKSTSLCWQNLGKENNRRRSMSSEIVAKSYTSRLHIGNPEGKIIIKTDQYNREDFQVVYPNAKFFVIKSYGEENVHKSIKYGVWSCSPRGNEKLDSAFRDAQRIAASSSTLCPVFLFFSVNVSNHFCGVAEMVGPVDIQKGMDFWSQDRWVGSFPVRWHIIKNIPNVALRCILLQNNEDNPVTASKNAQEIHYGPGTCMLKIFKASKANGCLLDDFTVYEDKEARGRNWVSKLRRDAPHFIPRRLSPCDVYIPRQPKADKILVDRIIRETHNLAGKDMHQSSWKESGNLVRYIAKASAQKENHGYGKQARENVVKAVTCQPLASNMPSAPAGGQLTRVEVEVAPVENERPQTAVSISSKAPEENPTEFKNALVHSASSTLETVYEEKRIIGEHCSGAISSHMSEACSSCLIGDVLRIGSMLVPMKIPS